jgi:hypothetical protein
MPAWITSADGPPHRARKLARLALLLAPVALSPSGRLQLLPNEAEVKYGDKVDVEFPEPGGGLAGDTALKYTARVGGLLAARVPWRARALQVDAVTLTQPDTRTSARRAARCA